MSAAVSGQTLERPGGSRASLFGPVTDGMLGFGGLYFVAFAVFWAFGGAIRGAQPVWVFPFLILLFSAPHYGATLLRVYEHKQDREQHRFVAVYATAALLCAFVVGVYYLPVASALTTTYLTWSPWHFSAQNFGIALMMLGRRGLALDPGSRRLFRIAFVASFALVAIVLHGSAGPADYSQGGQVQTVQFLTLGIPPIIETFAVPLLLLAQVLCIGIVFFRLLRRGGGRRILPVVGLVGIQAFWFTVPFAFAHFQLRTGIEPIDFDMRLQYFVWISLAHAIQYLWVTTYYARSSPGWPGFGRHWGKALLAGEAIAIVPLVVFAPDLLGHVSWRAGLFLLTASTLNLHHFILDGAIWKLRSSRVSRVLVHDGQDDPGSSTERSTWLPRLVWATAIVATVIGVLNLTNRWILVEPQIRRGDLASAARTLDQLAWFGADDERLRFELGLRALEAGWTRFALTHFERSVALNEHPDPLIGLAEIHARRGDPERAISALDRALALGPDDAGVLHRAGLLSKKAGDLEKARQYLERSTRIDPSNEKAREALAEVERLLSRHASR